MMATWSGGTLVVVSLFTLGLAVAGCSASGSHAPSGHGQSTGGIALSEETASCATAVTRYVPTLLEWSGSGNPPTPSYVVTLIGVAAASSTAMDGASPGLDKTGIRELCAETFGTTRGPTGGWIGAACAIDVSAALGDGSNGVSDRPTLTPYEQSVLRTAQLKPALASRIQVASSMCDADGPGPASPTMPLTPPSTVSTTTSTVPTTTSTTVLPSSSSPLLGAGMTPGLAQAIIAALDKMGRYPLGEMEFTANIDTTDPGWAEFLIAGRPGHQIFGGDDGYGLARLEAGIWRADGIAAVGDGLGPCPPTPIMNYFQLAKSPILGCVPEAGAKIG